MGIEEEKITIDQLLQKIDAGEVTRGEKGKVLHRLPNGVEAFYKPEFQTLTFTHNNITAEAVIHDGKITQIELTDPHTGNAVSDEKIKRNRAQYLQQCINSGELSV